MNVSECGTLSGDAELAATVTALRDIVPPGVVCAGGPIGLRTRADYPQEATAIAHAVPARQREFVAGRSYARLAMAALSVAPQAIGVGASRAPLWPAGIVGSISHGGGLCAALVAHGHDFLGVGLDVETAAALEADLVTHVCSEVELSSVPSSAARDGIDVPKLLFVIKEAVYKMYWPLAGHFLDFDDLQVDLIDSDRFRATLSPDCPSVHGLRRFGGRYGRHQRHLFAVAALGSHIQHAHSQKFVDSFEY